MALLSPQNIAITGTTAVYSTPTTSDTITPDTGLFLHVKNTNAAARTLTVVVPGTRFGQPNPDVAVNIPATTGDVMVGLPSPNELADPTTGLITVTLSATANVTSALLKV